MLILASASPRRRELLTLAGYAFTVEPSHVDETPIGGEAAAEYVERLAIEKAQAVAALHRDDAEPSVILGADTAVVLVPAPAHGPDILSKPSSPADAVRMLDLLSGRTHAVMTGVALVSTDAARELISAVEITQVTMNIISPADAEAYVASGEPLDKAGAYAIQGHAARWIPRIEGDFFNVVGLPICRIVEMLSDFKDVLVRSSS